MYLRLWIVFCALTVAVGWVSSAFHALVPATYEVFFLLFFLVSYRSGAFSKSMWVPVVRLRGRLLSWRLFVPGLFAISALLLLSKGLATYPSHEDGLSYRIPRCLHWIFHHQWYWISVQDDRLNNRGTVSEWLTVPILLFTKTDRLVFVPNWISYLFCPAMIFSMWRYLGVSRRLAWLAMWLIPTGFCFSLQACNCSNDLLATFFVLASFHLLVQVSRKISWEDAASSCLCIALATGVKANFMVYCLPWFVVFAPHLLFFFQQPTRAAGVLILALFVSFFPTGLMNVLHDAGWTGMRLEPRFIAPPIWVGLLGNTYLMVTQNLIPPLFTSTQVFGVIIEHVNRSEIGLLIRRYFEPYSLFYFRQLSVEQAGIGFVVIFVLAILYLFTSNRKQSNKDGTASLPTWSTKQVFVSAVLFTFFYSMAVANTDQPARLFCTFYPLLPALLFYNRVFEGLFRWRIGKVTTVLGIVTGTLTVLVFEVNPLLPVVPGFGWAQRAQQVLTQVAQNNIPISERNVGIIRLWNEPETWLWKPFGERLVTQLSTRAKRAQILQQHIHFIFLSSRMLDADKINIVLWASQQNAKIIRSVSIGYEIWYLAKMNS